MFDYLPLEIRQNIFSRVRYMDLFETARVSQGWWTLTMGSFERFHHKKDDFLLDQVDFCDQMMPKDEPWEWWMLMEFTKSKRLFLEISDFHALVSEGDGRLIQYFSSKQIHVKHLRVEKNESNYEVLRLPPNLNEVFSCLTSLEVVGVAVESHSTIVFPSSLISLRFGLGRILPSTSSIEMPTRELKVLDLKACGVFSFNLLGAREFNNLTRLSVSAYRFSASNSTRILRRVIQKNKTLKSVSIHSAYITKEWLKIFPSNVVKIKLFKPRLNQDLVEAFGNNVFYERLLLLYICEDWTSVFKFKTFSMSWEKYQEDEVNGEDEVNDAEEGEDGEDADDGEGNDEQMNEGNNEEINEIDNDVENAYQVDYTCKPTAKKESVLVNYSKVAINDLISKNNQGLLLTKLTYYHHSFTVPIPPNVRHLSILEDENYIEEENFELVLEDPSALQTLFGCHMGFTGRLATFPNVINLRELDIDNCNKNLLVSILCTCTSLSKLRLSFPDSAVFGNISSDIVSVSLKDLTVIMGDGTFEEILKHCPSLNYLYLEEHCRESILKSDTNTIKQLQYFKVYMQVNMEALVHLSTLEFPYMMFAFSRGWGFYAASRGLELVNEISRNTLRNNMVKARKSFFMYTECCILFRERVSLVYAKSIPTRFLRNFCHLVYTVQDFVDQVDPTICY